MSQTPQPKNKKAIQVEMVSLLGTLKEKVDLVRKTKNPNHLLLVFKSVGNNPRYTDASKIESSRVYEALLDKDNCPLEIVKACLKMEYFDGQEFAFKSKFLKPKFLTEMTQESIKQIAKKIENGERPNQIELFVLNNLVANPALPRPVRFKVENFCDKLGSKNWWLLPHCVRHTKRESWLLKMFNQNISGEHFKIEMVNFTNNPLVKDFMVHYAVMNCESIDYAHGLAVHPKISVSGLTALQNKFPNMAEYIDKIIYYHLDPVD